MCPRRGEPSLLVTLGARVAHLPGPPQALARPVRRGRPRAGRLPARRLSPPRRRRGSAARLPHVALGRHRDPQPAVQAQPRRPSPRPTTGSGRPPTLRPRRGPRCAPPAPAPPRPRPRPRPPRRPQTRPQGRPTSSDRPRLNRPPYQGDVIVPSDMATPYEDRTIVPVPFVSKPKMLFAEIAALHAARYLHISPRGRGIGAS